MRDVQSIFLLLSLATKANSFSPQIVVQDAKYCKNKVETALSSSRRNFITESTALVSLSSILTLQPENANAGIDPSALKSLQVAGDVSGTRTRLAQIEANQNRPEDALSIPFEELPSGVSYREFRDGKGEAVVQSGSKVAVEMSIRCRSFSTANEVGGLKLYSTKVDTTFNEIAWTVGSGELLPGLEEGMMGMHRNALRRIEVPSTMVFEANKNGQLPLPSENNKDGKRLYDRLFKTDATLLFEVLVTQIK